MEISGGRAHAWRFGQNGTPQDQPEALLVSLESLFECRLPLKLFPAVPGDVLRVRFSLWRDRLPLDALPQHGAIEVRLLPKATPELNAMDHLWKHTKREALGDRETVTIDGSALAACQHIIDLGPEGRLRQAGVLSGNFWLTR